MTVSLFDAVNTARRRAGRDDLQRGVRASLEDVATGEAPAVYQDAEAFFAAIIPRGLARAYR